MPFIAKPKRSGAAHSIIRLAHRINVQHDTATSVQSAPSASAGSINRDQKLSANRRDYRTIHAFTNGPIYSPVVGAISFRGVAAAH